MERRIFRYTISLLLTWLTFSTLYAQSNGTGNQQPPSQSQQSSKDTELQIEYPMFNGVDIAVDIFGPASNVFGSELYWVEAMADVNLKNKYFPTIELGYAKSDADNDYGVTYKTSAPYARIGIDYNFLSNKAHGNMLLGGLRYGFTSFKYDIDAPSGNDTLTDPVWGDELAYSHQDMKGSLHWIEFCLGIRTHISSNIYMGWNLRLRYKLTGSTDTYGDPYQVPGYGRYKSNTFGLTYYFIYKIPVKNK